jgi:hypothetical protein
METPDDSESVGRTRALVRMFQRRIRGEDVRGVIVNGETIEDYLDDIPYPSRLILGWRDRHPLHVVAAYNDADEETIVITVYEPDPALWSEDFRRRLQ